MNNSSSATTTVIGVPSVTKAYSPTSIPSGGSSTLTISLGNSTGGSVTLTSVLTDNIGAGLNITGISDTCPGTASFSGTTITYPSGSAIPAGGCAITATVTSATSGTYPNTIPVGALQTTGGSNTSAATATLTVQPTADLQITKTNNGGTADLPDDSLTAGSDSVYRIRVTNNGPSSVTGALLKDPAVSNLTANSVTCVPVSGNACATAPTVTQLQSAGGYTLPTLASGAFFEIELVGRVANNVGASVNNVATVSLPTGSTTIDPVSTNNSASDADPIVASLPAGSLVCDATQGEISQSFVFAAGSWTTGTTNNTASPFVISAGGQTTNMTISLSNQIAWASVAGVQSPALYTTGATANSLMTAHDASAANALMDSFTVQFNRPISKLQFSIKDVDYSAGSWQDRLVGRVLSSGQQAFDYTGTANCASDNATCNYPVSSGSVPSLTGMVVDFYSGPSIANPSAQFIAYNDFSWCVLVPALTINKTHTGNFAGDSNNTYTLTITNSGKVSTSGNITVQDLLPSGLTFQSVTSSAGSVTGGTVGTAGTQSFTVSGTTLAAGQSLTLTLTVKTSVTSSAQTVTNYASVGGGGDPDPTPTPGASCTGNQCASDPTTINAVPQADLTVSKTGNTYAKPGDTVTYVIRAWNNGPLPDPNASISDTMPAQLVAPVTWTCAGTGTASCGTASGTGSINLTANLPVDASTTTGPDTNFVTITVTGKAPNASTLESTPTSRTFTNTVNITAGTGLYDLVLNNSASAKTDMVYAKLTKSVRNVTQNSAFTTTAQGLPGEVLEYCIAYANYGNAALPNFLITDHVPGNTTALTTSYDALETSTATGFGVQLLRGSTTTYYTSAADPDSGALSTAGGDFGSGTMTVSLGTLAVGETGNACFRVTIK